MDQNLKAILDNLTKIAGEAQKILEAYENTQGAGDQPPEIIESEETTRLAGSAPEEFIACTPRHLPKARLIKAAKVAIDLNPANAPFLHAPLGALGIDMPPLDPLRIAVLTSKYWGQQQRTLTVSFMEQTEAPLRDKILEHMNAWSKGGGQGKPGCGIKFAWTQGAGDVRISRGSGGYWSYLGPDITQIPKNRQTMNLERFTMQTPDSEFYRVVRHETGHTLGFPHEHMRAELVAEIDARKATEWFMRTQGWDAQTVQQQVLTPLDERSLMATPADQTSIMCYQLPGSITKSGKPIVGGTDINGSDYGFAAKIYPLPGGGGDDDDLDWLV
jgi:hypothetical protein